MHSRHTLTTAAAGLMIALVLTGCAAEVSDVDRAQARVTAAEKDVAQAESDLAAASSAFCSSGSDYVLALDRYGDVLTATAPTVGDVRTARVAPVTVSISIAPLSPTMRSYGPSVSRCEPAPTLNRDFSTWSL